jgi:hypothetical protein
VTSDSRLGTNRRISTASTVLALLTVATIGPAGCGSPGGTGQATPAGTPAVVASSATTGPPSDAGATPSGSVGASAGVHTATASLPGTSYDRGPAAGQRLTVIGVPAGRTIPVQAAPGPGQPAVAAVAPLAKGVIAAGPARLVSSSVWVQATVSGLSGWIDGAHVAATAANTDLTTDVIGRLGSRPIAETMLDLGMTVARAYASSEPPSTITVVVAPVVSDLGQITLDVVGLGDDSVAGQRLHVVGTPGTESFTLLRVEGTAFCYRGVSPAGLCL